MPWLHSGRAGFSESSSGGPSLEAALEDATEDGDIYKEDCSSNIYPTKMNSRQKQSLSTQFSQPVVKELRKLIS